MNGEDGVVRLHALVVLPEEVSVEGVRNHLHELHEVFLANVFPHADVGTYSFEVLDEELRSLNRDDGSYVVVSGLGEEPIELRIFLIDQRMFCKVIEDEKKVRRIAIALILR